jgi:hypothetical protein
MQFSIVGLKHVRNLYFRVGAIEKPLTLVRNVCFWMS